MDVNRPVSVEVNQKSIVDILDKVLANTSVKYKVIGRQIALYDKNEMEPFMSEQAGKKAAGNVKDLKGLPIPGVSVFIKGTSTGITTDSDGKFSLNIPSDAKILVFSFVGMKTQEVAIGNKASFSILMEDVTIGLGEIVAVGYGTQRKKDLTGSVAVIKTNDLRSLPVPSISDALQGRAAGVQVITSGTPGSDATFRIRGIGTINNSNPLIVIDGLPVSGGLNQLNMDDIESIQILKDASATAIYGSRGANGVVIVTTKRGTNGGQSQVNFNYAYGIQRATNTIQMLNASQFASLHNGILGNAGLAKKSSFFKPLQAWVPGLTG